MTMISSLAYLKKVLVTFLAFCLCNSKTLSFSTIPFLVSNQKSQRPFNPNYRNRKNSVLLHAVSRTTLRPQTSNYKRATQLKQNNPVLNRKGKHYKLDRFGSGKIEFGTTVDLVTVLHKKTSSLSSSSLQQKSPDTIAKWLQDERRVAGAIWDPKLLSDLGDCNYRLQLMTLKFVTIQLAPSVDVQMWTEEDAGVNSTPSPKFRLQSIGFDPNVQILPGIGINAESLGIHIDVAGEMCVSDDGRGLSGRIGFVSSGILPPPLRMLPDSALRSATELISQQVSSFAIQSFERGAIAEYRKFLTEERRKQ